HYRRRPARRVDRGDIAATTAAHIQVGAAAPTARDRVVEKGQGAPDEAGAIPTDHVELAADDRAARQVGRLRRRRATAPGVRGDVVDVQVVGRASPVVAVGDIDFAVDDAGGHAVLGLRQRGERSPYVARYVIGVYGIECGSAVVAADH